MTRFVVDASVAVKWVVSEPGTAEALALLGSASLAAPDLLMAECANILWKKVQRRELTRDEALLAARILQRSDVEIYPTRQLIDQATGLAIELDHPAYDCIYVALALANGWRFVSADERFLRKLRQADVARFGSVALSPIEAAALAAG